MTLDRAPVFVAILLTCFNRRETTLATLAALPGAVAGSCRYRVVLVDDGSTDGTGEAVGTTYPDALVVRSDGNLFWNGGMRLAWQSSLPLQPDYFLWLNDDTVLRVGAIADLLKLYLAQVDKRTLIVGCTADPVTGDITYGGYRHIKGSWSRLRFRRLSADEVECDTMNGNCVLIPAAAKDQIGINSFAYRHAYGDNDYGLRARRAGWRILELKNPVGLQEINAHYSESTQKLTLDNWRFILFHPKGVAMKEWWAFCWNFGGIMGPVNFVARYLKMIKHGLLT